MEVLVTLDNDGHFGAVLLRDDARKEKILRSIMGQVVSSRWNYNDKQKAEAYKLQNEGTSEQIIEWMGDNELSFGRSGGGKIDIIEAGEEIPRMFIDNLVG